MSSENSGPLSQKIGFIGPGNMAKAICEGMVRQGLVDYSQIYVSGPHEKSLVYWRAQGAKTTHQNGKLAEEVDVIFLCVKPHVLPEAIADIYKTSSPYRIVGKLFISILAGVTIAALENTLMGFEGSRVVRVMTNTPLMVGEGCTAYCPGQVAIDEDIALVRRIFEVSGVCNLVPESMFDAICGIAGSGPAFIYLVIEALSDGAVKNGIPREMATKLAAQTVLGASKMVLETGRHTGTLKDEVCSPSGTTISGVHVLEQHGVRAAFMDAVEAATSRSAELSKTKETKTSVSRHGSIKTPMMSKPVL
ncbi:pyrroline-5-carboxylate reductase 3 [Agrilus planipennis]|uniref:Pyrroline-5-carboxylate reductase n=1 Tax=Agrilus planipennis TaxID=224129 RepID=A0A1W4X5F2_AGRPL|nr:pyrroline-5-carboxylate reductase 3 [Agrilus planipennis]